MSNPSQTASTSSVADPEAAGTDFFASSPSASKDGPADVSDGAQPNRPSRPRGSSPSDAIPLFFGDDDDDNDDTDGEVGGVARDKPHHCTSEPSGSSTRRGRDDDAVISTDAAKRRRIEGDHGPHSSPGDTLVPPLVSRGGSPAEVDAVEADKWTRRFLGSFVIAGWSLSRGPNYVRHGDLVTLHRPPPVNAAKSKGSSGAASKGPAWKKSDRQPKLVFGNPKGQRVGADANGSASKAKNDHIIRFNNERGFEVGRIPSDVAVWMSKVMDLGITEFEGIVVDCPSSLTVGCDILLEIKAYMKRDAFSASVRSASMSGKDPHFESWGRETAETADERNLRERKLSLVRLFRACTLKPSRSNDMLKGQRLHEDLDAEATAPRDPTSVAKQQATEPEVGRPKAGNDAPNSASGKLGASPRNAIAVDAPRRSSAPNTSPPPPEEIEGDATAAEGDGPAEENDGTEVTLNELDAVYHKAQLHDASLPEVEPVAGFGVTLRPYQKQALGWMIDMERHLDDRGQDGEGSRSRGRDSTSLHPLWEEYEFPLDAADSDAAVELLESKSRVFYFNPYTGDLSLHFQKASRGARGGILADEMGLGKTIQMAALIASNQPEVDEDFSRVDGEDNETDARATHGGKSMRQLSLAASFAVSQANTSQGSSPSARRSLLGPSGGRVTLVVAPMSLISQWREELERCIPGMTTMLYYAESKGDLVARLEGGSVDVVVTSFGTLVTEYKRFQDAGGRGSRFLAHTAPLFGVEWLRVILDEAHQVKNRATRSARACTELLAKRRWCLTGTPIVNRLTDLYSLLRFLRVEPWGDFSFFNSFVSKPFARKNPKALEVVQVILESVLLRREKKMKDKDGKSIVDLPTKTLDIVRLDFTPLERRVYEAVYNRAYTQYKSMAAAGTVSRNFSFIFSVLMRLRQCVCHPLLVLKAKGLAGAALPNGVTEPAGDAADAGEASEANNALGEAEEEIRKLVAEYQAGRDDLPGAEGAEAHADQAERAHLEALRQLLDGSEDEGECPLCMEEKSETSYLPCKHSGCRTCILEHLDRCSEREEEARCPLCRAGPFKATDLVTAVSTRRRRRERPAPSLHGEVDLDQVGEDAEDQPLPSTQDSQPAVFLRTERDFRSSTKLEALAAHLNQLRVDEPDFKAVIFSQFTSFLDLVEEVLRRNRHPFVRLDGATAHREREAVLRQFAQAPRRMVFLVSLRAGGVGLNLTSANHVWLLDCWWNAQIEDQAVDRIHRIGQARPVHVHRYIINDSIEDRILAIQKRKTALVGAALAGTRGKDEKSEALQNLELLFAD